MKLISMTAFVLEQHGFSDVEVRLNTPFANERFRERVSNYANFLKQPLKLEMFVPCIDGKLFTDFQLEILNSNDGVPELRKAYQQAKEKVLFEGFENYFFELKEHDVFVLNEKIFSTKDLVENLLEYKGLEFNLTPNAIKQLGL